MHCVVLSVLYAESSSSVSHLLLSAKQALVPRIAVHQTDAQRVLVEKHL